MHEKGPHADAKQALLSTLNPQRDHVIGQAVMAGELQADRIIDATPLDRAPGAWPGELFGDCESPLTAGGQQQFTNQERRPGQTSRPSVKVGFGAVSGM
jgi:hypothetical protein